MRSTSGKTFPRHSGSKKMISKSFPREFLKKKSRMYPFCPQVTFWSSLSGRESLPPLSNGASRYVSPQISASTRRRRFSPSHGGADFRSHTAAQIFAKILDSTWRHRCSPKNVARNKKIAGRSPAIVFFETVSVEQGFMTEKVCVMTEKVFLLKVLVAKCTGRCR